MQSAGSPFGTARQLSQGETQLTQVMARRRPLDLLPTSEEKGLAMRYLVKLLRDTRGVGAIEYVLVASLISVAAIAAFDELGGSVNDHWTEVETSMAA